MVKCPRCGMEIITDFQNLSMPFGSQDKDCKPQPIFRVIECPECKSRFRSKMDSTIQQAHPANVKELVDKIKDIHEAFVVALATLRKKIGTLEKERYNLLVEAEELRKAAESRANALENEVNQLRQEIKSLKGLLDSTVA